MKRPVYVLHLVPPPGDAAPDRRLRLALKSLLRSHELTCIHAHDAMGRPLDADEFGSGSPPEMARSLSRTFRHLADLLEASELPPDALDTFTVSLASLGEQVDALQERISGLLPRPDGSKRPNSRPRPRKPRAGL